MKEYNGVKKFKNDSFILIIERGYIKIYDISILSKIEVISIDKININEQLNLEYGDYEIIVSHINNSSDIYDSLLVNTSNVIYLDSNKIVFPVKLRALENGDKFTPFGMKGAKKVNDFLTDIKIDNLLKARVPIITNPANQIISVAGFRIDNKYRVCKETQSIYKIEFLSTN